MKIYPEKERLRTAVEYSLEGGVSLTQLQKVVDKLGVENPSYGRVYNLYFEAKKAIKTASLNQLLDVATNVFGLRIDTTQSRG